MKWTNKLMLIITLALPAAGYACGDYCDSGWAGAYETGGYGGYSSMYDIYQATTNIDITTTTYAPVYASSYGGGSGGCSSILSSCGGMSDFGGNGLPPDGTLGGMPNGMSPNGTGYPGLGDPNLIPRDPFAPIIPNGPMNPFMPTPGFGPMNPYPNYVSRDPAVLGPLPIPPYGLNPGVPGIPPYTGYPVPPVVPQIPTPFYPPTTPVVNPVVYSPVPPVSTLPNPIASLPSTPPNGGIVPRDPTTAYVPPAPAPWGGCDGITVPCGSGPVTRPTPYIPGSTGGGVNSLPNTTPNAPVVTPTNPTGPTIFNPNTHTGSTPPQQNVVPRGVRAFQTR